MKTFTTSIPRYIGITDFTTREQSLEMKALLKKSTRGMKIPPLLMVGLMISFKTLWNIPGAKWTSIFPPKEELDKIFPPYDAGTLNTLHYADFEDHGNWPDHQNLFYSLAKAIDYARENIHVVQLDMTWPDPGHIALAVNSLRHPLQVILQIGRKAIAESNFNPLVVADRLEDYTEVIDGVLLDQSMGEGKLLKPSLLMEYIRAISTVHPKLHIAVAGGLAADTLDILIPVLKKYPNISIDAQAGLREKKNAEFPIDWHLASSYLKKTGQLFKKYEK